MMPQARSVRVTANDPGTGALRALVTLPSRAGEACLTIRRFALNGDAPADDDPADVDIAKPQRMSISGEIMWGWYIDYDDADISEEEVRVLVGRPLVQDPVLSYPRRTGH